MGLLLTFSQIAELRKLRNLRRKPKPIPRSHGSEALFRRELSRLWTSMIVPDVVKLKALVSRAESAAYIADFLDDALERAEAAYALKASRIAQKWSSDLDNHVKTQTLKQLSQALSLDLSTVYATPAVADALTMTSMQTASMISGVPGQFYGKIAKAVVDNFTGAPLPEGRSLLQQISHITGISADHAQRIARDQTASLTGALTKARQESVGISEYRWRNARDNRVAGNPNGKYPDAISSSSTHGNHWEREGKIFRWDSPPPDGHPGQAINCRCYAEPVIDLKEILAHAETL